MIKILVDSPHTPESRRALGEMVLVREDRVQRWEASCPCQVHLILILGCLLHWTSCHVSFSRVKPPHIRLGNIKIFLKAEFSNNSARQAKVQWPYKRERRKTLGYLPICVHINHIPKWLPIYKTSNRSSRAQIPRKANSEGFLASTETKQFTWYWWKWKNMLN